MEKNNSTPTPAMEQQKNALGKSRIFWIALLASQCLTAAVIAVLVQLNILPGIPQAPYQFLRMVFMVVSLVDFPLGKFLRARLLAREDPQTPGQSLIVATIVSCGLAASINVFGVILTILSGHIYDTLFFLFLSVIAFITFRPTSQDIPETADASIDLSNGKEDE